MLWRTCILSALLLSVPAFSSGAEKAVDNHAHQDMMTAMQYTDVQRCHSRMGNEESENIVGQLVAAYALPGIDTQKVIEALDAAVARGCPFNEPDKAGFPPLQAAMLFNDAVMVRYILKHGGDPATKIQREGSAVDGMDAAAFMQWLLLQDMHNEKYPDRSAVQAAIGKASARQGE